MRIKAEIIELNREDLSNLFSDCFYGNNTMGLHVPSSEFAKVPVSERYGDCIDECIEDKAADVILRGGYIFVDDYYAEGESYGTLEHERLDDDADYPSIRYKVTMKDIEEGLSKEESLEFVNDYMKGNGDFYTGWNIMQIIIFGEIIYG